MDRRRRNDLHKLDAYRCALALYRRIGQIIRGFPRGEADLRSQMKRASRSVPFTIGEGVGKRRRARAAAYEVALGEAKELIGRARLRGDRRPGSHRRGGGRTGPHRQGMRHAHPTDLERGGRGWATAATDTSRPRTVTVDRGPWAVGRDRDRAELADQVRKTDVVRGKPLTRIAPLALSDREQEN